VSAEPGDERIVEWLREHGYHPRSPAHGSASCLYFLDDLLRKSSRLQKVARNGEIVYQEDYTVGEDQARWNTDLVLGPRKNEPVDVDTDSYRTIVEAEPARIWLAVDAKSIMTEHGKARRNRQRDINSFADIIHRYYPGAVTAGLLLINAANRFKSPLRDDDDVTEHYRIDQLVDGTLDIFREIDRSDGEISPNVDGVGCIVVEHTNIEDDQETTLVTDPPAPQPDDIVNYHQFRSIVSDVLEERFLIGDSPGLTPSIKQIDPAAELRERTLELAHHAHRVSRELERDDTDRVRTDDLLDSIESVEAMVDRLDDDPAVPTSEGESDAD